MRRRDFLGTAIGAVVLQSSAFGRVFAGKETDDSATFAAPIGGSVIRDYKAKGRSADGDWGNDRPDNGSS